MNNKLTARLRHFLCNAEETDTAPAWTRSRSTFLKGKLDCGPVIMGARRPGSLGFHYLPQIISGQKQGLGMVYEGVQSQAAMLAFNDIYRLFAIVTVAMIPTFLILRGRIGGGRTAPAH